MRLGQFTRYGRSCWRVFCGDCAWNSKELPFPDPDAALHCLELHNAVAHPEKIDWDKAVEKLKKQYGIP